MNNKISIITPSYNSEEFLEECIVSVISQTYVDWEMIIVDDNSIDNSRNIIKKFAKLDQRIKYLFLEKNQGAASCRNIAFNIAEGEFIAFLDADDMWFPRKLEKQHAFMIENDIEFSYTSYQRISQDGKQLLNIVNPPSVMKYSTYLRNTIIGCLTVMINRGRTGSFKMPDIKTSHDMVLWLNMMKRGYIAYGLIENLAYYRIVSTSNTSKKWKAAKEVWDVYRKIEKLSLLYSVICFVSYVYNAIKKRM